jgi:radical SAM protein with 4Fe4S-binding SPASM domain
VQLPADCTFVPLASGQLLVSRSHAVFCPVPAAEVDAVRASLADGRGVESLSPALAAELRRHGFFDPPRPAAAVGRSVQLQLTNACNLACDYCCTNSGRPRQAELGLEAFLRTVRAIRAEMGVGTRVAILGGEPLLVPWALELMAAIVDAGLALCLFTNGIHLAAPAVAGRVAALTRRGAEVRVSLAGPTPAICDAISGAPRFEAVVAGVAALVAAGGACTVDLMLLPQHVGEVAEHLPALRRRLPAGTPIAIGVLYHSGREHGEHLFGSRAELEAALDAIAFGAGEIIAAAPRAPVAERREGCGCALGHHLHVRSDGALFTCFKMEERVGDLTTTGFAEALREVQSRPHPATTLPACRDCAFATLCGGGCRSENLQLTGDADAPVCGEWRVRVLAELLAEEHVGAVEWPAPQLLAEAHRRGIPAPARLEARLPSRHLTDT